MVVRRVSRGSGLALLRRGYCGEADRGVNYLVVLSREVGRGTHLAVRPLLWKRLFWTCNKALSWTPARVGQWHCSTGAC
jgi:hypothetical protein